VRPQPEPRSWPRWRGRAWRAVFTAAVLGGGRRVHLPSCHRAKIKISATLEVPAESWSGVTNRDFNNMSPREGPPSTTVGYSVLYVPFRAGRSFCFHFIPIWCERLPQFVMERFIRIQVGIESCRSG
jgi:hypothetical protein